MNKLKINLQVVVCLSLFTSLMITSCKDDDKAVEYYAQATIPKYVNPASHGGGEIKLKVLSNVHETKNLNSKVTFTDDKGSVLVSPKGDSIKKGEEFSISGINEEYTYKFNSDVLGKHNVEIKIKNSEGVDYTQKSTILVKGDYEFDITIPNNDNKIKVGDSIKVNFAYKAYDPQAQECSITKLEVSGDTNATIGGRTNADLSKESSENDKKAGQLKIVDTGAKQPIPLTGELYYKPTVAGIHDVNVTVKNQFKIERKATFKIEVTN